MFRNSIFASACLFVFVLSPVFGETSFQELTTRLEASDPAVRLDVVRRIAIDYPVQGQESLFAAAGDPDEYVRERAIQALGQSGSEKAITLVLAAMEDQSDFVRWRAVQALSNLGTRDEHASVHLAKLVSDRFWRVRVSTFQLLGQIARSKIVVSSPELSAVPGGAEIRELLLVGLNDPDERARVAAARALATGRDGAAFEPLVELMNIGSMFIRHQAALGLGDLGDKRAVAPLIEALETPHNSGDIEGRDWVRWGIVVALEQLTGEKFKLDTSKWRQWLAANNQQ